MGLILTAAYRLIRWIQLECVKYCSRIGQLIRKHVDLFFFIRAKRESICAVNNHCTRSTEISDHISDHRLFYASCQQSATSEDALRRKWQESGHRSLQGECWDRAVSEHVQPSLPETFALNKRCRTSIMHVLYPLTVRFRVCACVCVCKDTVSSP